MSSHEWAPGPGIGNGTVDTERCRASVWHPMGNWGSSAQCSRKASMDGKWCKQHAPRDESGAETWYVVRPRLRGSSPELRRVRAIVTKKTIKTVKDPSERYSYSETLRLSEGGCFRDEGEALGYLVGLLARRHEVAAKNAAEALEKLQDAKRALADHRDGGGA